MSSFSVVDELRKILDELQQVEKVIDEINELANSMRRALLDMAYAEAEKRKQAVLEEMRAWQSRLYDEEVSKAEEAAREIQAKGVYEVEKVRRRAEQVKTQAEELVRKTILGIRG
ncbi:MAG: hypothetical protein QXF89_06095 [Candidatus Caldarchaeum sp.]